MKIEQLKERLENYKPGTFIKIAWEREIGNAKAKKAGIKITKKCEGIVRACINYNNLTAIKNISAAAITEKKESWFEHASKGLVRNKRDISKLYLQVFPVNTKKIKSNVHLDSADVYFEDGSVSFDELYKFGYINKSDLPNSNKIDTFTLNVDNILSFGG